MANFYFWALLALGCAGLVLSISLRHRRGWIVPLIVLYFNALHSLLFFGTPRYHAPFVPMLCLLAALSIDRLLTAIGYSETGSAKRIEPVDAKA